MNEFQAPHAINTDTPTIGKVGIGGWLLLLIIKLWFGTAFRLLGGLAAGLSVVGIFNIGSAILCGTAALLLGLKKPRGVAIAKIALVVDIGLYLLVLSGLAVGADLHGDTPWFRSLGYLIAATLYLIYLYRSVRVKNTYFATTSPNSEDEQVPSKKHGWDETIGPIKPTNATQKQLPSETAPTPRNTYEQFKAELLKQTKIRLQEMVDNPADNYRNFVDDILKRRGNAADISSFLENQLSTVNSVCEYAYSACTDPSAPRLPDVPDSNGSFQKELQGWAVASSGMRVFRALDIRAAIEAYKSHNSFDALIKDRDYLLAIVKKNAGGDGTSMGTLDAAEYETASAPEAAYRLMIQASQDMLLSEMWAYVAELTGDDDFRKQRYEKAAHLAATGSLEYWSKIAPAAKS